jgi:hypothetical protein
MNDELFKNIDKILLSNLNYIPEAQRRKVIEEILDEVLLASGIKWMDVIKLFKSIIDNNKQSSLCAAVFCVDYIKKLLKKTLTSYL